MGAHIGGVNARENAPQNMVPRGEQSICSTHTLTRAGTHAGGVFDQLVYQESFGDEDTGEGFLLAADEIENSSGALKPGQFATVRILLPRSDAAVLVPARAVRTESGVSRVFVVKNGHAEQRLVQLGQTEGDLVEIKSGVAENEIVATSNVDQLSDGAAVRQ